MNENYTETKCVVHAMHPLPKCGFVRIFESVAAFVGNHLYVSYGFTSG